MYPTPMYVYPTFYVLCSLHLLIVTANKAQLIQKEKRYDFAMNMIKHKAYEHQLRWNNIFWMYLECFFTKAYAKCTANIKPRKTDLE